MRLEALAEVGHADDCVGDGQDDEQDGDDGKGREGLANSHVVLLVAGLVNADELEEEVAKAAEVEDDGNDHAGLVLAAGEESGGEEDQDRDGNGGDGEGELGVTCLRDNNNELDDEAEEEEEIELEEGDVDLGNISLRKTATSLVPNIPGSAGSVSSCDNRHQCS